MSAASSLECSEEYDARQGHAVDVVGAERVAGDGRDHAPSRCRRRGRGRRSGSRSCRRSRAGPTTSALPHLGVVGEAWRDGQAPPACTPAREADRRGRARWSVGSAMGRSRSTTSSASLELRRAGEQRAVGVDDERVAVEDELVLAADHVDVGERAAGLARPPRAQLEAHVVLVALVRRPVDDHEQSGAGVAHLGDRPAVLPEVLADGERDVDAVDADHGRARARDEVAELVEHAVVGQVVLGVARRRPGRRCTTAAAFCGPPRGRPSRSRPSAMTSR